MAILLMGLLMWAQASAPVVGVDPSIDAYWQASKARLELAAEEWQARIQSVQDAAGDRAKFAKDSIAITGRFRGRHATLLADYGVSEVQFLHFASEHAAEIDSYLEANESLRLAVARLRQTIQALVDQFDAAAAPLLQEGPQP